MVDGWRILLVEAVIGDMRLVGMYTDPVVGGRGKVLIAWAKVWDRPEKPFTAVLEESAADGTFEMWFHEAALLREQVYVSPIGLHIDGNYARFAADHLNRFLRESLRPG